MQASFPKSAACAVVQQFNYSAAKQLQQQLDREGVSLSEVCVGPL